jgi:hypothetical protein
MTEQRCGLWDLPMSMCAHCRDVILPEPSDDVRVVQVFSAKYDSRCYVEPAHPITAGEDIGLLVSKETDERVGYACLDCVRELGNG